MDFSSPPSLRGIKSKSALDTPDFSDSDGELSIVSQSPYFTQPTQIVERPTLKPQSSIESSPRSIIEVPASSPFKPQSALRNGGRLANLMAPAGTNFKAPAQKPAQKPSQKLAVTVKAGVKRDFIMISDDELNTPTYAGDDSSDDGKPARGNIQPSSFRPKEPKAKPQPTSKTTTGGSPLTSPPRPGYIVKNDWAGLSSSQSDQERLKKSPVKPESAPKPPRRRLMQGRRARDSSPAPSPVKPKAKKALAIRAPVIVLSDNDDEDEYQKPKRSPDAEEVVDENETAFNERVLHYLNTCNTIQLVAIANVKEDSAKSMLSHKPFSGIEAAKNVTISQKKGKGKKSARVTIGSDIVSAVKAYISALDGIDHVIGVCERQAEITKTASSTWVMDSTGQLKADDEKPLTPRSGEESKLVDLPIQQPGDMDGHCVMKSFQIYGLNWLWLLYKHRFGAILADDMGLGKTCQVISLICTIVEQWEKNNDPDVDVDTTTLPWPNLIVVPPSTLANWAAEFKRFAPDLNVTIYQGSQMVRDEIAEDILEDTSAHHVVLTSYSQLSRQEDVNNLKRIQPEAAIFDEGHKMKNPKTKLYKDLIRVTAKWRLILSGTPVQNNLMEMISLLKFIEPKLFRDHFDDLDALFNQKVSLTEVSQGALLHSERVARARTILEPFILQRRKEQVLKDLPPKTSRVVYCEMDKIQASIYKDYERRFRKVDPAQASLDSKAGRENDNNNVWIQLRKSAIHPQLFRRFFKDQNVAKVAGVLMKKIPQSELRQPDLGHLTNELKALSDFEIHLWCRDYKCIREYDIPDGSWMESAKVQTLLKLIHEYQENGDRVLVFTRYAKVIEILGESLASSGIEYLSLQGNTDVSERQKLINTFNEDETIPVFLLTTGSGGTGINLTAANKVIIFDQSDNPQDDVQAENRAHRLGQKRPVEIIRLISKDTIEELIYKACQKKLELANKVTGWSAVEMTSGEMEAMVREELLNGNSLATPPSFADA
ncbi:SNF2 family N-terminal domain-containing protein [Lasiosphaeria hispida]|uniref:SNF2 family N-terminal domain-containing protein n=1 Tax=Lasiosphaeria hispida TaxID=260671 RepID=A0AAJ0M8F2_9PEZI|nr:SNF2 family N-terminal domain-containing protein [Lasiosphaeria hispida]